jgi:hypothetical protein
MKFLMYADFVQGSCLNCTTPSVGFATSAIIPMSCCSSLSDDAPRFTSNKNRHPVLGSRITMSILPVGETFLKTSKPFSISHEHAKSSAEAPLTEGASTLISTSRHGCTTRHVIRRRHEAPSRDVPKLLQLPTPQVHATTPLPARSPLWVDGRKRRALAAFIRHRRLAAAMWLRAVRELTVPAGLHSFPTNSRTSIGSTSERAG